jgi:hypothetical protein
LGSGVSSIDERRFGSPVGGGVDDLRVGGSSGSRAVTGDGGTGSVGGRAGAAAGVISETARVVDFGGIVMVGPSRPLGVRGGCVGGFGGCVGDLGGCVDGVAGVAGRDGAGGGVEGDAGREGAGGGGGVAGSGGRDRDAGRDSDVCDARAGGISGALIEGTLGVERPCSVDKRAMQRSSSGAISRIALHTTIACCARLWSR